MTDPVFLKPIAEATAGRVAQAIGASLRDASLADVAITHAAAADSASEGALVYVDHKRHALHLSEIRASAVICREVHADLVPAGVAVLIVAQPQAAFAAALGVLYPAAVRPGSLTGETGISPNAFVHPQAVVEPSAIIEAGAVVGPLAAVGSGSVIGPNAVIGEGTQIGRDCHIGASTTVQHALLGNRVILHPGVRIGQDGFGYVGTRAGPEKIAQIGRVVIQDDVEIGANTTVDRGALSDTIIGERTKIDNLVQIAHNVQIGRCCVIAAMCGVSGSVKIGNFVRIGGNAGFVDHVTIGDGAQIAAKAGVMHDIPAGEAWGGAPAQPMKAYFREVVGLRSLKHGKNGDNGDKTK